MTWIAQRQAVTAANIANADTPGYRARQAADFDIALAQSALGLARTSPGHLQDAALAAETSNTQGARGWGESHSGNSVSLEQELMEASKSARMMSIDTSLTRTFHRMVLTSLKG